MLMIVGKICFVLLAMIGLTACCYWVLQKLLRPRHHSAVTILLSVRGHEEDIEYTLKSLIAQYQWAGDSRQSCRIVCLDHQMDEETKFICERICQHYPFVKICNPEQACELLER